MIPLVAERRDEIAELCRRFGVRRLDLFGSAADGRFDEATSDLDFVADFADPLVPGYADRYFDFTEALEVMFGRPVDVVTERSIKNPYFRRTVDATRQLVYDGRDATTAA
jgi:uncharacterized protein